MKRASFLKRLSGSRAEAGGPAQARAAVTEPPRYVPPEERAHTIFRGLYPDSDPADFPRAMDIIAKGLRDAETGAVLIADRTMFLKGVDTALQRVLAVITDPATCIDPVTGQPTASHFDWRNITGHIVDRIQRLNIEPPPK